MTGLLIAVGLVLLVAILLKFGARLAFKDMAAPGTALLLGLAGYAWQGRPATVGHPVAAKVSAAFDERLAEKRRSLGERVGPASKWLVMSDGLARSGDTQDAANIIARGLEEAPNDADLWVGLGNALLAHGEGRLSPAADYAYRRALALGPEGISANYFYGLALAQTGQLAAARSIWTQLAARLPEQAELRAELARNTMLLDQLIAQANAPETGQGSSAP